MEFDELDNMQLMGVRQDGEVVAVLRPEFWNGRSAVPGP